MNEDTIITVRIETNNRTHKFEGTYFELHTKDWNEIVRADLDDEYFRPEEGKLTVEL